MTNPAQHVCPKCGISKPMTEEYFQPRNGKLVLSLCRDCRSASMRAGWERKGDENFKLHNGEFIKRCPCCNEWKPANTGYFYGHRAMKRGLASYCQLCDIATTKRNSQKKAKSSAVKPDMHTCISCQVKKPFTPIYFYRSNRAEFGLVRTCKPCWDRRKKNVTKRVAKNDQAQELRFQKLRERLADS